MKRFASFKAVPAALLTVAGLGIAAIGSANPEAQTRSSETQHDRATLRRMVWQIASEHGIESRLIDALIQVESDYNPNAVSRKGAQGLMQLMPATSRRLRVSDPFDPEQNIRAGVQEMARLIDYYAGDLPLALAAYNAGQGAVAEHQGIPPYRETRNYVMRVLTLYTGKPYRLGGLARPKAAPTRLVRDPGTGETIITNLSGGTSQTQQAPLLGGGFGN